MAQIIINEAPDLAEDEVVYVRQPKKASKLARPVEAEVVEASPTAVGAGRNTNLMVWEEDVVPFKGARFPYWSGSRKHNPKNDVGVLSTSKNTFIVATYMGKGRFEAPIIRDQGDGFITGDAEAVAEAAADNVIYAYSRLKDAKDRAAEYAE